MLHKRRLSTTIVGITQRVQWCSEKSHILFIQAGGPDFSATFSVPDPFAEPSTNIYMKDVKYMPDEFVYA